MRVWSTFLVTLTAQQLGLLVLAVIAAVVVIINVGLYLLWRGERCKGRWNCPHCAYSLDRRAPRARCPECGRTSTLPVVTTGIGRYIEVMFRAASGVKDYGRDSPNAREDDPDRQ